MYLNVLISLDQGRTGCGVVALVPVVLGGP